MAKRATLARQLTASQKSPSPSSRLRFGKLRQARPYEPPKARRGASRNGATLPNILAHLRDELVQGKIPAGAPLMEKELAARFAVSRTPIREALVRLEGEGLVELDGRTMCARRHTPEEIFDLFTTLIVLEECAASLAAERHSEVDAARLSAFVEQTKRAGEGDVAALADASLSFHEAVAAASHSPILGEFLSRLEARLQQFRRTSLSYPGRARTVVTDHARLAEAILARDVSGAGEIARAHIVAARAAHVAVWKQMLGGPRLQ